MATPYGGAYLIKIEYFYQVIVSIPQSASLTAPFTQGSPAPPPEKHNPKPLPLFPGKGRESPLFGCILQHPAGAAGTVAAYSTKIPPGGMGKWYGFELDRRLTFSWIISTIISIPYGPPLRHLDTVMSHRMFFRVPMK